MDSDKDEQPAGHVDTIKRGLEAVIVRMKGELGPWIEQHSSPGSFAPMKIALLELAIEQQLVFYAEEDAFELVESASKEIVRKKRGPLQ